MYLIYYLVHDQKILAEETYLSIVVREMMRKSKLDQAKQVRGSRASAGLQVKWRQVLK